MSNIKISLHFFNNCLTILVAVLAIYIVAAPFLPQVAWWVRHDSPVHTVLPGAKVVQDAAPAPPPNAPNADQLIIAGLNMREVVHGGDIRSLRQGVWHLPRTSTPDKGGNTVLVGHRFTYSGQAVFYHLDKVRVGDPIQLTWQGKKYNYKVAAIKVVPPTEISVEANTKDPLLTIYTCTPLWSAKDRLVIQARPTEDL